MEASASPTPHLGLLCTTPAHFHPPTLSQKSSPLEAVTLTTVASVVPPGTGAKHLNWHNPAAVTTPLSPSTRSAL